MAFQLSPGVNVTEIDLTTVVPSVSSTAGAFAGAFTWGPVNKIYPVDTEITLAQRFTGSQTNGPDSNTYISFMTAASFLAYGNNLQVVRACGANANNAVAATATPLQIQNSDQFQYTYLSQNNNGTYGSFVARYPGALGNSLTVSVCDANTFSNAAVTGTVTAATNSTTITGTSTAFLLEMAPGTVLYSSGSYVGSVLSVTSNTSLTLTGTPAVVVSNTAVTATWAYSSLVNGAPGTSALAARNGSSNDEIHVVVVDSSGAFSGAKGTILEVWPFLSKAYDSLDSLSNANYYKTYLWNNSKYIYAIDPPSYATTSTTWGLSSTTATAYATLPKGVTNVLTNGSDQMPTDASLETAWGLFANPQNVDISLVITANADVTLQQYIIDNIVNTRLDCVAFISPPSASVINQAGNETTNITTWNNSLARSTSYAVADCGWKYMFDKYNNVYRWIPLNGDIAGLCVYTDTVRDPWYSPAGFNRGNLKNVIKLAWNPNKTQRDALYSIGINPVATFPGNGTVLYGDKTLQAKPSAFDRINVRRLFIVLEKAIALAAKYSLFEFNDSFTQAQFVSLVTPFLREVQGRRGIYDFRVVCDSTNNTPFVVDSNQFVGDIYIKPARSINFIQLNFVAVGTGVDFTEVVGKF